MRLIILRNLNSKSKNAHLKLKVKRTNWKIKLQKAIIEFSQMSATKELSNKSLRSKLLLTEIARLLKIRNRWQCYSKLNVQSIALSKCTRLLRQLTNNALTHTQQKSEEQSETRGQRNAQRSKSQCSSQKESVSYSRE